MTALRLQMAFSSVPLHGHSTVKLRYIIVKSRAIYSDGLPYFPTNNLLFTVGVSISLKHTDIFLAVFRYTRL
jgi:hypothetical protein